MTDKIHDIATRQAMQTLHGCIQEIEAEAQEYRACLRNLHQTLLVIDGLLNVATFRPMEERLAHIRQELQHGFECLDDAGIDGDTGRDTA